jgi:hypothetical protein
MFRFYRSKTYLSRKRCSKITLVLYDIRYDLIVTHGLRLPDVVNEREVISKCKKSVTTEVFE